MESVILSQRYKEREREKKREGEKHKTTSSHLFRSSNVCFPPPPLFYAFLHSLLCTSGHFSEIPVGTVSSLFSSWSLQHWESSVRAVRRGQNALSADQRVTLHPHLICNSSIITTVHQRGHGVISTHGKEVSKSEWTGRRKMFLQIQGYTSYIAYNLNCCCKVCNYGEGYSPYL